MERRGRSVTIGISPKELDMPNNAPILSLGSINADFACRVRDKPGSADLLVASQFGRFSGGKALNRAWLARRLGHPAFLLGRVGDDDLAGQALHAARSSGVDTGGVTFAHGAATGVAMITVPVSGKKQIVLAENANTDWDDAAKAGAIEAIGSCTAGGVLALDWEVPPALVKQALETAAETGLRIVADPSPADQVDCSLLRRLAAISPNHFEAGELTGTDVGSVDEARKAATRLRAFGVGLVCVRLEDGGVVVGEEDEYCLIPPLEVDPIDTTGAGDAFAAGLAVGFAKGWTGARAAALGNAAAAITTTVFGSQVEDLVPERLFEIADRLMERVRPA